QPKSFQPQTTHSQHRLGYHPNLLTDRKPPTRINEVWVGDLTDISLRTGRFGNLALLMDLFSRRIVGWPYGSSMAEELVLAALSRGIQERQPEAVLIHHSDRGGQFASRSFRGMPRRAGKPQSMSAEGNCHDNAVMESCLGTIKTELQLVDYADDPAPVRDLSGYIHNDNFERRHAGIGYDTPAEFERKQPTKLITTTVPKSATDPSVQFKAPRWSFFAFWPIDRLETRQGSDAKCLHQILPGRPRSGNSRQNFLYCASSHVLRESCAEFLMKVCQDESSELFEVKRSAESGQYR
ncbi:MAG: DDE-type integrase/transposase/recombinase, partial [Planctomycetaceae bacterium]|nr:DDE-type integrase/transposase/recombinase [Planctomycetaceae bacterium]